jgi:hypothetical protein
MKNCWISFIALIVLSCTSDNAPEKKFYFEIKSHGGHSNQIADYLKENISNHKYTITNHSGLDWPFYKELQANERISKDSLMPPHWFVHQMIFRKPNQQLEQNDFLVRIELSPKQDTLPNYSVDIFKMDSTGLVFSAGTGIHYIDSTEFTTHESLNKLYLKSIIRYSFK